VERVTITPIEGSTNVQQFNWVTNWLSKNKMNKTLQNLIIEVSESPEEILPALPKVKTIESSPPLLELSQLLKVHTSSVLCVRFHRVKPWIISTDSFKNLFITSLETTHALFNDKVLSGAIITLDTNPLYPNLLLAGTMDNHHGLLEIIEDEGTGKVSVKVLQNWKSHSKFVVRVKWGVDGRMFATASHDKTIIIWQLDENRANAKEVKKLEFESYVEGIEFTKDGKSLIAAVRENVYLQYIKLDTWEISLVNVNELGDDYVSFTVLEIKLSPDGSQLLASTDMSRAILFRQGTETQLQNFYGYDCEGFGQPRSTFDNRGLVYVTSADFRVYVYDTNSGAHITTLPQHTGLVRDLDYHPGSDLLASCSFDQTIKIFKRPNK